MQQISESEKEILAIILVVGLFFAFAKGIYENVLKEKLTLYNLFHPVKRITARERLFILNFLKPFHDLTPAQRKEFLRRFAWFKSKKHFVFYGNIQNKEDIKAYVSASAILLTLGLNDYRFEKSIRRVIIYPSKYYSRISRNHHVGEYNPRLRTLVFSAESLKDGFSIPNDNINLGIHEVAHALMIDTRKKQSFEAKRFKMGLLKMQEMYHSEEFINRLAATSYFRDYGKTNFVEFFAVVAESFIETPETFKRNFPKLFEMVRTMFNFDLSDPDWKAKN
ncbi:zinc-dependent peptidase [Flagellimonas sp. GZD32]|uniref:zinc-dependent peptidase n=1 Tax=Flagellimonas cixiensis TaxID=3228750 RepID=UPI0035C8EC81